MSTSSASAPQPSVSLPQIEGRQTLLFDADDTLWENNIYFERAIAGFIDLVAHPTLSDAEVRQAFNDLEHERVKVHGYGTDSFRRSMLAAFAVLRSEPCGEQQARHIAELTQSIVAAEIELLPGVEQTLQTLHTRHNLVLMTKGDPAEQVEKLQRSGLAPLFRFVEVVREKHREAYQDLRSRYRCELHRTWMIGNSPKSDINPALAAGMHAIFVPHANTWVLEHAEIAHAPAGQHLLVLQDFSQLASIF